MVDKTVNHPGYYQQYPVEVIQIAREMIFPLGSAIKYLLRYPAKGDSVSDQIRDLEKAAWYLDFLRVERIAWSVTPDQAFLLKQCAASAPSLIAEAILFITEHQLPSAIRAIEYEIRDRTGRFGAGD